MAEKQDWLLRELPSLVTKGVITEDSADRLRAHYADAAREAGPSLVLIVLGTLGALLIGLGIILLLAHNWEQWTRSTRTVVSFAPLLTAQLMCGWVLYRHRASVAWRESSAIFLILALAACIALIGQTYHIPGDLESFLLVWGLLSLPLLYLLGASMVAVLYWMAITGWAGTAHYPGGQSLYYLLLMALAVPYFIQALRDDRFGLRASFLGWGLALSLAVGVGVAHEGHRLDLWNVLYAGLFSMFYLLDLHAFGQDRPLWRRPWLVVGAGGIVVLGLLFTMEFAWRSYGGWWWRNPDVIGLQDFILCNVALVIAVLLWVRLLTSAQLHQLLLGGLIIVAALGQALAVRDVPDDWLAGLANLYVLALGLATLRAGFRQQRLTVINAGLVIISALVLLRFFDSDLPFTLRGIAFILVGAGFLAINLWLRRRQLSTDASI